MSAPPTADPNVESQTSGTGPGWGHRVSRRLAPAAFTSVAGLFMAVVLIQAQGFAPWQTLVVGLEYALGDLQSIARTLAWGTPLYVAAIGVAVAFRAGMFNIGAEGQIYSGAMGAALAGAYLGPMLSGVHIAITVIASALAGGSIAAGLGWLRAAWGVDEVLSTLLSNYIVILFCSYLATGPLRDPTRQSGTTREIRDTAVLPELIPRTGLTAAIFLVVVVVALGWWLSERSVVGYRWRMTGESTPFAAAVGINVKRSRVVSMAVSGALCGVAGGLLVTASQGRFWTEIGSGIGWDAVLVALIGRARPIPTVVWVTIYCVMRSAARGIEQVTTVPAELSLILIAAIIIAASARAGVLARLGAQQQRLAVWRRR